MKPFLTLFRFSVSKMLASTCSVVPYPSAMPLAAQAPVSSLLSCTSCSPASMVSLPSATEVVPPARWLSRSWTK